jgi:hypothetical protein
MSDIRTVSDTFGTLRSTTTSLVRSEAAISGSAAFFEPLTQISPDSGVPPVMRSARSRPAGGRFLAAARSRQTKARFSHRQSVLKFDLFVCGERAGELLLRPAARVLGLLHRYLLGVLSHVGQHRHTVGQHLEESTSDKQDLLGPTDRLLDA